MPELPEAETLVRGLRPHLPGHVIRRTRVLHPDVLRASPRAFRKGLTGRQITAATRRAKNIVLELDGGEAVLVVNLGMTGGLILRGFPGAATRKATHPALLFHLEAAGTVEVRPGSGAPRTLVYDDVRRFGCVEFLDAEAWAARSAAMGPEPLSPGYRWQDLHHALQRSRTPLRNWLLDQRRIAGVGNIYASEACFRAGVDPRRPANAVEDEEARRLHRELRDVLESAIRHGGTTLRDYRNAQGEPGRNQRRLLAYGREGEPCTRCGTPIERIVLTNRSAFLCPRCQS